MTTNRKTYKVKSCLYNMVEHTETSRIKRIVDPSDTFWDMSTRIEVPRNLAERCRDFYGKLEKMDPYTVAVAASGVIMTIGATASIIYDTLNPVASYLN